MKLNKKNLVAPLLVFTIGAVIFFFNLNLGSKKGDDNIDSNKTAVKGITEENFNSLISRSLKKREFVLPDKIITNRLEVNSRGRVKWKALFSYPDGCGDNQAIQKLGDKLTCIDIVSNSSSGWSDLTNFPSGCPDGQAVQSVGETLTCVEIEPASSLWTDGGSVSYLSSATDSVSLGGTNSSAPFYFNNETDQLAVDSFQSGSSSNNFSISDTGIVTLNGTATVFEDIRMPVTSTTRGGSKIPGFDTFKDNGSGSQGVFTYWFDAGLEEELYFTIQLPHEYKEGSNIYPHVHWVPAGNGTGSAKVSWGLEYTWANRGDIFPNTNIIYANISSPNETLIKDKQYLTSFSSITGTNKTISSMLSCRIFRNAGGSGGSTDDYSLDAGLLEIDFHYEKDKLGSDGEF